MKLTAQNIKPTIVAFLLMAAETSAWGAIRYVSPTGNDANSGTSWATPKQTIQAAIDASSAADTVMVTNGVYALNKTMFITNLVLLSVNGSSVTIVDGQNAVRCLALFGAGTTVNGFTVRNGRNLHNGGGIYCNSGAIVNCVITNNTAVGDGDGHAQGGGIYLGYGSLSNCVVAGNTALSTNDFQYDNYASGGGVYTFDGVISDCVISNNTCNAIYADGGGVTLSAGELHHSLIVNNSAVALWYASGGGINANMNGTGHPFVDRCLLLSNSVTATETGAFTTSSAQGGGFYIANSTEFRNCVIAGNSAVAPYGFANGGGGSSSGSTVENCTVVNNRASAPANSSSCNGGGIIWGYSTYPINNIILFNTAPSLPDNSYVNPLSIPMFVNCNTSPIPDGVKNISADPLFVNAAGGDYHLQPGSPCRNAGSNEAWMAGAEDLDGKSRIADGTVEIGAFELSLQPGLAIIRSAAAVILTWPADASGFTLQSTTNLVSPVWITHSQPVIVGGQNVASNSITDAQIFFRLRQGMNQELRIKN